MNPVLVHILTVLLLTATAATLLWVVFVQTKALIEVCIEKEPDNGLASYSDCELTYVDCRPIPAGVRSSGGVQLVCKRADKDSLWP